MKENTLLKMALIASLLGLCMLFLISRSSELSQTSILEIDDGMKGEQVKVFGTVQSVRSAGDFQIIRVSQPSSIAVFVGEQVPLAEGDYVEVIGRVDEYKEDSQIIADRIRKVS